MRKDNNIKIIKGHDPGACIWIMPVKADLSTPKKFDEIEELKEYEVSIDDDVAFGFFQTALDYSGDEKYADYIEKVKQSRERFKETDD